MIKEKKQLVQREISQMKMAHLALKRRPIRRKLKKMASEMTKDLRSRECI